MSTLFTLDVNDFSPFDNALPTRRASRRVGGVVQKSPILYRLLRRLIEPTYAVYVVSYPKTGRSWLRVMLGKAVCLGYGQPDALLLRTPRLTAAAGLRATRFSHEDAIFD